MALKMNRFREIDSGCFGIFGDFLGYCFFLEMFRIFCGGFEFTLVGSWDPGFCVEFLSISRSQSGTSREKNVDSTIQPSGHEYCFNMF